MVTATRYASRIPGANLIELAGADHLLNGSDVEEVLAEVEEFVTGQRSGGAPERALANVSFTDIVRSTERARLLGDRPWSELLQRFRRLVTAGVVRHRSR